MCHYAHTGLFRLYLETVVVLIGGLCSGVTSNCVTKAPFLDVSSKRALAVSTCQHRPVHSQCHQSVAEKRLRVLACTHSLPCFLTMGVSSSAASSSCHPDSRLWRNYDPGTMSKPFLPKLLFFRVLHHSNSKRNHASILPAGSRECQDCTPLITPCLRCSLQEESISLS